MPWGWSTYEVNCVGIVWAHKRDSCCLVVHEHGPKNGISCRWGHCVPDAPLPPEWTGEDGDGPPTNGDGEVKRWGPNVYGPLSRAVNEVRAWYEDNPDKHKQVCDAISFEPWNIEDMATESWEVPELHNIVGWIDVYQEKGCATPGTECKDTVEVQRRCWHSADLAYVAFGAMRELCGFALWSTQSIAEMAKIRYGPRHMLAAKYWAGKGWMGWPGGGEPLSPVIVSPGTYPQCEHCMSYDPSLSPSPGWMFDVYWGGIRVVR